MMSTPHSPEHFEERLLRELREVVAARAASDPLPCRPVSRARHVVMRRIVVAPVALAAAAAGTILALGHDGSTPAYAVEPHSDGTVTVEIHSLRDAAGLQSRLRGVGVPAMVDYVPDGKACREPRFRQSSRQSPRGIHPLTPGGGADGSQRFTVDRNELSPGERLVLTSTVTPRITGMTIATADGPVAPCTLIDAPPASATDSPIGPHTHTPAEGGHKVTEGHPYEGVAK